MSIYLGEKLFAGRNGGGGGITMKTLFSGSIGAEEAGMLTESIRNYDLLVAIAGISGSKSYQYSGIFGVEDIPTSGYRQLYLSTPFQLNDDKTMKNYCSMTIEITTDTAIKVISKNSGWSSGRLFKLYGIKFSA